MRDTAGLHPLWDRGLDQQPAPVDQWRSSNPHRIGQALGKAGGRMQWRRLLPGAFCAAFLAGLFVVCDPATCVLVFIAWVSALVVSLVQLRGRRDGSAGAVLLAQVAVVAAVVSLAAVAPVKTRDRLLSGRVILPKAEMSLRELQDYAEGDGRQCFPVRLWLSYPESQAARAVRWAARGMTLREFLDTIEGQSRLRYRFGGCGNGTTILWGGNCCFGAFLSMPADPE